ncbi:unnamed protein product [Rotaria sp. Silwood1]|nr:unnamed protein product [Rotaria sp. Silwood1]CAF1671946.1 unnamed protein product [Rotaria sp. Silwood1]CAF3785488.1 unnamed protein product [Rotaria sp. Silwood1]CAF3811161.1 unnamed protein product [Rotaria sp. Silwood1]CAF3848693.1 unnamed protein product [Rotaria sp. Silwood1]
MGNTESILSEYYSSIRTSLNSITPLYEACRDGDDEKVQNLLTKYSHLDINRQEFHYGGNTCLHIAAAQGHDNIVKLLLKHGCYRSSLLNSQNQSAYDMAALHKESTRLLFLRQDTLDLSSKYSS